MAAEGAGDGWRAVGVGGLAGAELDSLEALQHAGAFVVLVVLLVADGTPWAPQGCCRGWVEQQQLRPAWELGHHPLA